MSKFSLAALILLATAGVSQAQQIEWKQVINTPKGQNLPRDRADILGIELGDTIAEARAKLTKLAAEGATPTSVIEEEKEFSMQAPGAQAVVTASFVARLVLQRQLPGKAPRPIEEKIAVYLSAPSSGQQVLGIERDLDYHSEADQPLVSELIGQLKHKLKSNPREFPYGEQAEYVFQFDNGQPYMAQGRLNTCYPGHNTQGAEGVPQINSEGNCDASMQLKIGFGISRNHARYIYFLLVDNERSKANLGADFAFVQDYVQSYTQRTGGAAPKL